MGSVLSWLKELMEDPFAPQGEGPSLRESAQISQEPLPPSGPDVQRVVIGPQGRKARIEREVMMIAPHFTKHEGVHYDVANCDWLMIPKYPLPAKWQNRWCSLLILFPETYPITPPIGFYLNRQFRLRDGGHDPHFVGYSAYNAPDLQAQGWFWYCVRIVEGDGGGWRPSPDYRKPDNLWTFLAMVREALTNYA